MTTFTARPEVVPANSTKRRLAAFSDWHAQGCALHVFVMERSINKIAALQQVRFFYC
jgi:hypothetical protein